MSQQQPSSNKAPRSSAPRSNGPRGGAGGAAPAAAASSSSSSSAPQQQQQKKISGANDAERQSSPDAAAAAAAGTIPAGDETRLLVDWHHVGAIIGKGGQSVKQIREESGCAINIIAPAPNAPSPQQIDRIMSIKGGVAESTKAIYLIAHTIQARAAERKAAGQEPEQAQRGGRGREPADGSTAIKLLVHRAAVGAVIGKAGDAIRQTQAETGARIQVSSEPLGHSTDKTVSISGTPEVVETATRRVLTQLAESPLRAGTKTVHYVPGPAYYNDYNGQDGLNGQGGNQQQGAQLQQQQVQHAQQHPNMGAGAVAGSGPISIQKIAIPTICAGCVIGRSGTIIRDLRSQSGTNISIADPDPSTPDERVVTITGSPGGIQTAVYLIRQCVESYVPPQQQQQQGGAQDDGQEQQQAAGQSEEQTQQEQSA